MSRSRAHAWFVAGAWVAAAAAPLVGGCGTPHLTYAEPGAPGEAAASTGELDGSADAASGAIGDDGSDLGLPVDERVPAVASDAQGPFAMGTCSNQVIDADETGVDCGGAECPRCFAGLTCKADSDCVSAFCHGGVCTRATCIDGVANLKETDVDCGGGDCRPCNVGASCRTADDCALPNCVDAMCQPPAPATCSDAATYGDETDARSCIDG